MEHLPRWTVLLFVNQISKNFEGLRYKVQEYFKKFAKNWIKYFNLMQDFEIHVFSPHNTIFCELFEDSASAKAVDLQIER